MRTIRSLRNFEQCISLHDCILSALEITNDSIIFQFDSGFILSYNEHGAVRSGKSKITFPINHADSIGIKKIKDHRIFHRYFGIITHASLDTLQKYIHKGYVVEIIDEYYTFGNVTLTMSVSKKNNRSNTTIITDIPVIDDVVYEW